MAKVLIVNPIIRAEDDPRHVPYGLALLAGVASREGHQIQVFDSNGWRPSDDELVEAIQADDWDVIATGGITTAYGNPTPHPQRQCINTTRSQTPIRYS